MNITTFEELRDVILTWCQDITNRELVLANAGEGPKPRNPYVEVFISVSETIHTQDSMLDVLGTTETISTKSLIRVQLDLYGNNPMQDASKLMRSLYSARRYLDLWKVCGLSEIETANDLTALETGALKQRAQVVFSIYAILSDDFNSDYFDNVPISVEIPDYNNTIIVEGGENPREKDAICFT